MVGNGLRQSLRQFPENTWPYPDMAPGVCWHKSHQLWYVTKTINGRRRTLYLGRDPKNALVRYHARFKAFCAGTPVTPITRPAGTLRVRELVNAYLGHQAGELRNGNIGPAHHDRTASLCHEIAQILGPTRVVASLVPEDFGRLLDAWERFAPTTRKKRIDLVGTLLKWGERSIPGYERPFVGTAFRAPPRRLLRRARNARRGEVFSPAQVRSMLAIADELMRPAILLAVNMGAGSADLSRFRRFEFNLDRGIFNGSRHKTEAARYATLWPETIEALRKYKRPNPANAKQDNLFFLNTRGLPIASGFNNSTIHLRFNRRIRKPLNLPYGFYTLKSTFVSFADQLGDERAKKLITGHVDDDILGHYSRRVIDKRVRMITNHVREELGISSLSE